MDRHMLSAFAMTSLNQMFFHGNKGLQPLVSYEEFPF